MFQIEPVELGRRFADSSMFLHLTDPGIEIEIAYRVWLLRRGNEVIVVDTGPPVGEGLRRGLTAVEDLGVALARRGVDPAAVATVLLTHFHWDHAANADVFPNARFVAQRGEIEFFASSECRHHAFDRFFSHHAMLEGLIRDGRVEVVDGDRPLSAGLSAMRVGGHTPGSQMLVVETAEGRCVLTGDAVPLNRNFTDGIPSGILVDLREAVAAIARVRALDPVALYTGHDLRPVLTLRGPD